MPYFAQAGARGTFSAASAPKRALSRSASPTTTAVIRRVVGNLLIQAGRPGSFPPPLSSIGFVEFVCASLHRLIGAGVSRVS